MSYQTDNKRIELRDAYIKAKQSQDSLMFQLIDALNIKQYNKLHLSNWWFSDVAKVTKSKKILSIAMAYEEARLEFLGIDQEYDDYLGSDEYKQTEEYRYFFKVKV